jgi:cell wall-associated NlpC family hydrolase
VFAQRSRLRALTGGWKPLLAVLVAAAILAPATAAHADPSVSAIEQQIATQGAQLEKIVEQYNKVNEDLKANQAAADKVNADLKALNDQLSAASTNIGEIAASAYKGAPLAQISSVFEAGDPSTMVNRLVTLDQITKYQNGQIHTFTDTKAKADAEKAKLDQLVADEVAQRQSLDDQKGKILAEVGRLDALKKKVQSDQQRAAAIAAAKNVGPPPSVSGKAGVAVNFAYAQLGKPYVWAAAGPSSYDCSGLTEAAWGAAGVSLPHNAAMQYRQLPHISRGSLSPGDLVFYSSLNHVGIYVGNGQIIHAPTFGDVVKVSSVDMMSPYGYARPS